MPEKKVDVPKVAPGKTSSSDGAKPVPESSVSLKDGPAFANGAKPVTEISASSNDTKAPENGAGKTKPEPSGTASANDLEGKAPSKHPLNLRKIVPLLVLLLAAVI